MPAEIAANVLLQLIRLRLSGRVGRASGAIEAVKAYGVDGTVLFQQRYNILKLPPAHEVAVQQHDAFSLRFSEMLYLHFYTPPRVS